jgi:hypothetical protein
MQGIKVNIKRTLFGFVINKMVLGPLKYSIIVFVLLEVLVPIIVLVLLPTIVPIIVLVLLELLIPIIVLVLLEVLVPQRFFMNFQPFRKKDKSNQPPSANLIIGGNSGIQQGAAQYTSNSIPVNPENSSYPVEQLNQSQIYQQQPLQHQQYSPYPAQQQSNYQPSPHSTFPAQQSIYQNPPHSPYTAQQQPYSPLQPPYSSTQQQFPFPPQQSNFQQYSPQGSFQNQQSYNPEFNNQPSNPGQALPQLPPQSYSAYPENNPQHNIVANKSYQVNPTAKDWNDPIEILKDPGDLFDGIESKIVEMITIILNQVKGTVQWN